MKELTENNIDEIKYFFYYTTDMMKNFSNLVLEITVLLPIYSESVFNEIEINTSEELKLKK
jgi:hypothetical protein